LELLKAVNRRDGMLVPIETGIHQIGVSSQYFIFEFHELNEPFP